MQNWQQIMADSCTDVSQLQGSLGISDVQLDDLRNVQETFPMLANPYYLSLVNWADPDDPIRKLCIPELIELDGEGVADTSGEQSNTVVPGLQHKYGQTALLLSTSACAIYCRHCFRRRFVGVSEEETVADIEEVAAYIREHDEITNVLVSGGDAFMNSNAVLRSYLEALCGIEHLRYIRFGTRTPVVLPQRITTDAELLDMLAEYSDKKQLYVVTHFDHPNEVTREACDAARMLMRVGVPVRNQTVLLRSVNDSPEVLAELMDRITGIGVLPYYLFQCRPVTGVKSRFQVPLREGYGLVEAAKAKLNGLAKGFRFAMSHPKGKIEILGPVDEGKMLFKFHQAKDPADMGRLFTADIDALTCWLPALCMRKAGLIEDGDLKLEG